MDQTYITQQVLNKDFEIYRLLTLNEVRKTLKVSYATLRQLIESGRIATVKIRKRERISAKQLTKFIDNNSLKKQQVAELNLKTHKEKVNFIINKHTR